jgi:excisionase family DNA binding protein
MKDDTPLNARLTLSAKEVGQRLGVCQRVAQDMMTSGELPCILVRGKRKVRLTDLEAWLAAQPVLLPGELGHAS